MESLIARMDGNWIDIGSLFSGVLYVIFQMKRPACLKSGPILSKQTALDFVNGTALFPLMILSLSVLSSDLVQSLLEASRLSLSIAGIFSVMAILEAQISPQSSSIKLFRRRFKRRRKLDQKLPCQGKSAVGFD